jgi:IclR family acetate operon transcriptional repressor
MSTSHISMTRTSDDSDRVVGSDRVLLVLVELANHANSATLDELAKAVKSPKPTVHRALASLCRAGLANKDGRGRYILGDEFLRMAFSHHESRPDHVRVQPILRQLAERHNETAHYAVLDGQHIIYRTKVDPTGGSIRLTSTIGGRNPAHSTAIGKLLLSSTLLSIADVRAWIGTRTLVRRTPNTITSPEELHRQLERVREVGFALDDEENEQGVNCIALPYFLSSPSIASGGVSVSALSYRTPLQKLVEDIPALREIVAGGFED